MRVATFNIYNGVFGPSFAPSLVHEPHRIERQCAEIRALGADVVCLQEVHDHGVLRAYQLGLGDMYGTRYEWEGERTQFTTVRQVGMVVWVLLLVGGGVLVVWLEHTVRRQCLDTVWVTCVAVALYILLVRRLLRSVPYIFTFGRIGSGLVLLYRRETVRPRACAMVRFAEQSGDPLNALRPRGFLYADLESVADGARWRVYNTHTDALPGRTGITDARPGPSVARRAQLEELFRHAGHAATSSVCPWNGVVVCGDLNTVVEDNEIPAATHGFEQATPCTVPGDSPLHTWDPLTNTLIPGMHQQADTPHQLDYIFHATTRGDGAAERIPCVDCKVALNTPGLSDHYALVATFQRPR